MHIFEQYHALWQRRILMTCFASSIIIALFEVVFFFLMRTSGLLLQSVPEYILHYMLMPMLFVFLSCAVGYVLLRCKALADTTKSIAALCVATAICTTVACVHNVFDATMICFAVPITMSVVFGRAKITNVTGVLCVLGQVCAVWTASRQLRGQDSYFLLNSLMYFLVFGILWFMALLLIKNEREKRRLIDHIDHEKNALLAEACRDKLTGLHNLMGLQLYVDRASSIDDARNRNSCIAFLDIDNFKRVNDAFGHEVGNQVLIRLSEALLAQLPPDACVARYGGDEFIALVPGVSPEQCQKRLDALLLSPAALQLPQSGDGGVSFSCGVCAYDFSMPLSDAIRRSDSAMYAAKLAGKNRTALL